MSVLNIHSIFESVSGEAGYFPQGAVCTFIRFQGCNLKCRWCDTAVSQHPTGDSKQWVPAYLAEHCQLYSTKRVLITGGEPLFQREGLIELINELTRVHFEVQIETNGSYCLPDLNNAPHWVVDVKPPSSGYWKGIDPEFIDNLGPAWGFVHLKFVVENRQDILFAIKQMRVRHLPGTDFIVSPVGGNREWYPEVIEIFKREAPELMNRIVFSLQLHKIVNMA